MFVDDLKTYLESNGYENIGAEYTASVQESPNWITIRKYAHPIEAIHDGTSDRYIRIEVRHIDAAEAESQCNNIFNLLDSGGDETLIMLTPSRPCIGRPRNGTRFLKREENTITYYCELVLWSSLLD